MKKKRVLSVRTIVLIVALVFCFLIPSYAVSRQIVVQGIGTRIDQVTDNGLVDVAKRTYIDDGKWDETSTPLLLGNNREIGGKIVPGKIYPLKLSIANTGEIDSYDRVAIYKYFTDQNGKNNSISASHIEYTHPLGIESNYVVDDSANTVERNVLYYRWILPVGATYRSSPGGQFIESMKVDNSIMSPLVESAENATTTEGNKVAIFTKISPSFITCNLEVKLDAVQTHNAKGAIESAWGRKVNIGSNGELSLT